MNADDLRELKKLKDDGIITEEEFHHKKKEFLETDKKTDSRHKPNFDLKALKSLLGISSIVYFISMFFPFFGEDGISPNGWSGWRLASDGDLIIGSIAYILYLIPIGSGVVTYQLLTNGTINKFTRFFGIVPFIFTGLIFFKIKNEIGDVGPYNSKVWSELFDVFKQFLGFGLILSYVSGSIICFHPKKSEQPTPTTQPDSDSPPTKKSEQPIPTTQPKEPLSRDARMLILVIASGVLTIIACFLYSKYFG